MTMKANRMPRDIRKLGCHSRDVDYTGASLSRLASLTRERVSSHCEQFITYECHGSALYFANAYGLCVSRGSSKMIY